MQVELAHTHIAFVHDFLMFGGGEMVSLRTAHWLWTTHGVKSTFFVTGTNGCEDLLPEGSELCLLPESVLPGHVMDEDNVQLIADEIMHRDIRIVFILTPNMTRLHVPERLRRLTPGCRYLYWLHLPPLWEVGLKRHLNRARARMSRFEWLKCNTSGRLKYDLLAPLTRYRYRRRYLRCFESIDGVIVLHDCYKHELVRDLGLTPEESSRVYPLINVLELNPAPVLQKKKCVVYVGRLSAHEKQVDLLLRTWHKVASLLPDWELRFYGQGPAEGLLRQQIEHHHIPRVRLMGYASDTQAVYDEAAVLCLPSVYEGWGLVLAEAQNNGVVPLAFESCAATQIIIGSGEHAAGEMVKQGDWQEFARRLVRLCQDDAYRARLQERCLTKRLDYRVGVNDAVWEQLLFSDTSATK